MMHTTKPLTSYIHCNICKYFNFCQSCVLYTVIYTTSPDTDDELEPSSPGHIRTSSCSGTPTLEEKKTHTRTLSAGDKPHGEKKDVDGRLRRSFRKGKGVFNRTERRGKDVFYNHGLGTQSVEVVQAVRCRHYTTSLSLLTDECNVYLSIMKLDSIAIVHHTFHSLQMLIKLVMVFFRSCILSNSMIPFFPIVVILHFIIIKSLPPAPSEKEPSSPKPASSSKVRIPQPVQEEIKEEPTIGMSDHILKNYPVNNKV